MPYEVLQTWKNELPIDPLCGSNNFYTAEKAALTPYNSRRSCICVNPFNTPTNTITGCSTPHPSTIFLPNEFNPYPQEWVAVIEGMADNYAYITGEEAIPYTTDAFACHGISQGNGWPDPVIITQYACVNYNGVYRMGWKALQEDGISKFVYNGDTFVDPGYNSQIILNVGCNGWSGTRVKDEGYGSCDHRAVSYANSKFTLNYNGPRPTYDFINYPTEPFYDQSVFDIAGPWSVNYQFRAGVNTVFLGIDATSDDFDIVNGGELNITNVSGRSVINNGFCWLGLSGTVWPGLPCCDSSELKVYLFPGGNQ